jgi:CheY-like chemotaxis protein
MTAINILWVDDEIDLLKPHVLFLEAKGYHLFTTNNGQDALALAAEQSFDVVFLDENMPGLSGLETLTRLKAMRPEVPVIMITKSEEERIMDQAIGSKIADYLIKPVNPNQILLSLKKTLENKRLISEKTTTDYQGEFRQIAMELMVNPDTEAWVNLYKKLVYWELELEQSSDEGMKEILRNQKAEANTLFTRFVEKNYKGWLSSRDASTPLMSHTILKEKVFPVVDKNACTFLIVVDNLRLDQWRMIAPIITQDFRMLTDETFFSILPTATQYARNAMFSGLLPSEMEKKYPNNWFNEDEEEGKNQFEDFFLEEQLKRLNKNYKVSYNKILNLNAGRKLVAGIPNLRNNQLNVIIYNFVDMLSHSRTDMEVIRELAVDEAAYRSLTLSWFEHSPLREIMKGIAALGATMIITTDHGSIRVNNAIKVVGDKNTNSNLRYKVGKSLNYNPKEVFEVRNPADAFLPRPQISSAYIFAKQADFFAYPNNYNYYVSFYRDTFQHGGISMEEIIIPFAVLSPKQ